MFKAGVILWTDKIHCLLAVTGESHHSRVSEFCGARSGFRPSTKYVSRSPLLLGWFFRL